MDFPIGVYESITKTLVLLAALGYVVLHLTGLLHYNEVSFRSDYRKFDYFEIYSQSDINFKGRRSEEITLVDLKAQTRRHDSGHGHPVLKAISNGILSQQLNGSSHC